MEWDKSVTRKCPSCMQERDTCAHVLNCDHVGRVKTLHHTADLLEIWLEETDTQPNLLDCIMEYVYGRGGRTMVQICNGLGEPFQKMARDQDEIGWRRFMEGMICSKMRIIQEEYHSQIRTYTNSERWAKGVV
jgi:hypothetical protein